MKKIGIAIVFILLIAGIGSPIFSGMIMERVVKNRAENMNKMYADQGSDIDIAIVQYDRDLLSSEIEWRIGLGSLNAIYGVEEVILIEHVKHGISGITSRTSLEKNKWFTDFIETELDGKNPLDIQTRYEILGNIKSSLTLDGFSIKGRDMNILPAKILIQSDKKFENLIVKGDWEGMSVPGKIKVNTISFDSKNNKISAYIWQGDTSLSTQQVVLDTQNHFALSNFKCDYTMDYDKTNNLISVETAYGVGSIKSRENNILDAFVRLGIKNIDAPGYEEFVKIYSKVINDIIKNIDGGQLSPEDMKEVLERQMIGMTPKLIGALEKVLKKGLEIQIGDLRAQLPQGKIKGDISLSLNQDMTMAQFLPIAMQPALALDIFSLKSDISLPKKLTGENPNLLAPVYPGMQTGLFLKKEENLIHNAETRDGKLFINGEELVFN